MVPGSLSYPEIQEYFPEAVRKLDVKSLGSGRNSLKEFENWVNQLPGSFGPGFGIIKLRESLVMQPVHLYGLSIFEKSQTHETSMIKYFKHTRA